MTTTTAATFLDTLLAGDSFPFEHQFDGPYAGVGTITYRELLPSDAALSLVEAIRADVEPLGLDPLAVVMTSLSPEGGDALTGAAFLAHQEALDGLDLAQRAALGAALQKISGALVAQVLGSWDSAAPINAENCAKLPPSIQRTILELAQSKTLEPESKNGSGPSPSA